MRLVPERATNKKLDTRGLQLIALPRHMGEVAPSYGDGGGEPRSCSLQFQIMICKIRRFRLRLAPSVADYRATSLV
jgi:hypothetical protein